LAPNEPNDPNWPIRTCLRAAAKSDFERTADLVLVCIVETAYENTRNRVRKWRREAGLPERLSEHGMRKAATHWGLRNHRDLITNNFALKAVFGWVTEKELIRYTRDFDREAEAVGC